MHTQTHIIKFSTQSVESSVSCGTVDEPSRLILRMTRQLSAPRTIRLAALNRLFIGVPVSMHEDTPQCIFIGEPAPAFSRVHLQNARRAELIELYQRYQCYTSFMPIGELEDTTKADLIDGLLQVNLRDQCQHEVDHEGYLEGAQNFNCDSLTITSKAADGSSDQVLIIADVSGRRKHGLHLNRYDIQDYYKMILDTPVTIEAQVKRESLGVLKTFDISKHLQEPNCYDIADINRAIELCGLDDKLVLLAQSILPPRLTF